MANVFLSEELRDVETAIMLEQAIVHDIGNAVAYTDGDRVFINTDDNLYNILPAYSHKMLKWLLWHERYHKELRHHNRFFKYLDELKEEDTAKEFQVAKSEVNIIMDILVHDSLCKMFPDLIETAQSNLAQMRNRNSLEYTFKTFTLEEMLDEYKAHKKGEDGKGKSDKGEESEEEKEDEEGEGKGKGKSKDKEEDKEEDKKKESKDKKSETTPEKEHGEGGSSGDSKDEKAEDGEPEIKDAPMPDEHDKTDWSKLNKIEDKEFIEKYEGDYYEEKINKLKRKKFKLGKLTETLNGLVTSTRRRTYAMPSSIYIGGGVMLKGSTPRTY